jgi:DDE superfamily endonuclease
MSTELLEQYLQLDASDDDRPCSLLECMDNGILNSEKYLQYSARESEREERLLALQLKMIQSMGYTKGRVTYQRGKRKYKALTPYYFDDDGTKVYLRPRQSSWYMMYVKSPSLDNEKFKKKFRRRFRMPYELYKRLVERIQAEDVFRRWHPQGRDAFGTKASPIELLLLGALRYLGRGLTFDDLEEYTAINEETHRQFFHVFIDYCSTTLYKEFVKMPTNAEEYEKSRRQYDIGGLTGAGFSTDATNVVMWRCSHNLRQANMGFKQSHPARTYNLTCNHNRRILHSTTGHPSRWNDKTLAHFDEFMCGVHEGKILQDVKFILYSWEGPVGASRLEATKYAGAWGLVDNGYHRWACTQAPAKHTVMRSEERLSEWIESFRKDAECTFGILKGRFRVLKTGIRLEGAAAADKVWLTCCALHNLLLEEDDLDDWNGDLGLNEVADLHYAPLALQRLGAEEYAGFGSRRHEREVTQQQQNRRNWEALQADNEDVVQEDDDHLLPGDVRYDREGAVIVNSLSYDDFRNRLVEHFDILHRQNKVRWPRRKVNSS